MPVNVKPTYKHIALDITSNCNLRCPFCVNDFSIIKGNHFMKKQDYEKVLTLLPLIRPGGAFLFSCIFEPTLHPDFIEYVKMVPRVEGVRTFFTTNLARPLPDSLFEELSETQLSYINISLDSLQKESFEILRKRAKYEVFFDNLERMVKIFGKKPNAPKLRYITVLSKMNIDEAIPLLETTATKYLAIEHEFRMFWIRKGQDEEWVAQNILTWEDLLEVEKKLKQWKKKYRYMFSPFEPEVFTFIDNSQQSLPLVVPKTLTVFSDGTVNLDAVPDVYRKQDVSFKLGDMENPDLFFENIGLIMESMERKELHNHMQQNNVFSDVAPKLGSTWMSRFKKKRSETPHFVDTLNEKPIPTKEIACVESGEVLTIGGWAVDIDSRSVAGGVIVKVDDRMYLPQYGFQRDDVALMLREPQYRNSGFITSIPTSALEKGTHTVSLYILSNDRKSYYVSPRQVQFTLQ